MIKIFKVILFISYAVFSYAGTKSLTDIKSLKAQIEETTFLNNDIKKSTYNLRFVKPNKFRKDVLTPELNKGEVYTYIGNEKSVYLPFFAQVTKENIDLEENDIMGAINYLLNIEKKDPNFVKEYYEKKVKFLKLENGVKIEIENLKNVGEYLLPFTFHIYEGGSKVATLNIDNYTINPKIADSEFILK